ncbi:MAG: molybdopterin-dependent oxidoreductase, partial [Pseudomonadota bacterium]
PRHILERDIDPPVGALFVYNHNPVAVHPHQKRMRQALSHPDLFTVISEVVMTDSVPYADVVLPACSHFEHDDVYGAYGQHYLQRARAVISPVGEALPNAEVFRRLAQRFGFDSPEFQATDQQLIDDAFLSEDPLLDGLKPSAIDPGTAVPMEHQGRPRVLFENVYPATPSGKIELYSESLHEAFDCPLPTYKDLDADFPLTLITPSSDKRCNAIFGGCADSATTEIVEIHPDDAQARGLRDGDEVRVWNERGEVNLTLKITADVRSGVLCSPKGTWLKTSRYDQTVNALIPDHKTDIGDGACYNDTRVEIGALGG